MRAVAQHDELLLRFDLAVGYKAHFRRRPSIRTRVDEQQRANPACAMAAGSCALFRKNLIGFQLAPMSGSAEKYAAMRLFRDSSVPAALQAVAGA